MNAPSRKHDREVLADADSSIRLQAFQRRWAPTVLSWIGSREELLWWAARTDFPLADPAVFDQWHSDPEVCPYVLLNYDEPLAYGEVWIEAADGSAELGRLVVAPRQRGQGLGRTLVERLATIAQNSGACPLRVRVFPENAPAIGCYRSAGFTRLSSADEEQLNAEQRFPFVWMER